MRLVAVDPGDEYVGIAEFQGSNDAGWICQAAWELAANEFLCHWLPIDHLIDVLVVEEFSLYANKALVQTGSTMKTSQMIGAIKHEYRYRTRTRVVTQPAGIQTATRKICTARKIRMQQGGGTHSRSAQLHGWYYILKTLGENPA